MLRPSHSPPPQRRQCGTVSVIMLAQLLLLLLPPPHRPAPLRRQRAPTTIRIGNVIRGRTVNSNRSKRTPLRRAPVSISTQRHRRQTATFAQLSCNNRWWQRQTGRGAPETGREEAAAPARTGATARRPWSPEAGRQEDIKFAAVSTRLVYHPSRVIRSVLGFLRLCATQPPLPPQDGRRRSTLRLLPQRRSVLQLKMPLE